VRELPAALAPLGAYRQFILYKAVPSESRPGKTDKLPIDSRDMRVKSAHDHSIWLDARTAMQRASELGEPYGIGFVFTENDPFWVVDIDGCLTPTGWAPHAQQVAQLLSGCAMEVSRSGIGMHLIGSGKPPVHGCKNEQLNMEFYHTGRFIALTGISAQGSAAADLSAVLYTLTQTYFPPDSSAGSMGHWSTEWSVRCDAGPDLTWSGPPNDDELIQRALKSKSANSVFGVKASFADLWLADPSKLASVFPADRSGDPWNASQADSALAQHLAFWTGKDCGRIERLMWQSKLVRDKWGRQDYLPRTILGVVARQVDVLKTSGLPAPPEATGEAVKQLDSSQYLTQEAQESLFSGCFYITDQHKVLVPGGMILKPDQFRVHYGGRNFTMSAGNDRTSRDPWEAFTQSQILSHPKVNGSCFRPDLPAAEVVHRNGMSFVNTYIPIDVPRVAGDAGPFLDHIARLLPEELDQKIILSYMAACVQYKGRKFRWAPLLQGVEGNGKTLLTHCVAEAIGRRYVHWPKASKLAKEFNAWMVGKILYAVEDIYVPGERREIIEELKPMITGDQLEIEAKGVDQISSDICGNFMFNSNHRDAIQKTKNDRRFCVMFTAQQAFDDLRRDGMTVEYFVPLYNWLKSGGYAVVAEFLHTYQIPAELNPAGDCQRAPFSSTTGEAISASVGGIEQEIEEAISQGLPGFCGGWVSSHQLEKLLERLGRVRGVTHLRRKEMLESIGYRWHPALKDGRVNNLVLPDHTKPRLYVHDSNLAKQITDPAAVAKEYERCNTASAPYQSAFRA